MDRPRPQSSPFEMSMGYSYLVLFIASLLVLQYVAAQSDDEFEYQRSIRAPKPKFIRFGRGGGAKFIRFGRSGTNTWEDVEPQQTLEDDIVREVKRGAKFIRFG